MFKNGYTWEWVSFFCLKPKTLSQSAPKRTTQKFPKTGSSLEPHNIDVKNQDFKLVLHTAVVGLVLYSLCSCKGCLGLYQLSISYMFERVLNTPLQLYLFHAL